MRVFEDKYDALNKELRSIRLTNDELSDALNVSKESKLGLDQELDKAKKEINSFKLNLESKDKEIAQEKAKYRSLDEYWRHESTRAHAGFAHKLNTNIMHEINEARLSLDGDNPDIQMALSRLNNMQRIMERAVSSNAE
jgi:chromosome segregation ATPase